MEIKDKFSKEDLYEISVLLLQARDKDFERLTKLCLSTANPPAEKAEKDDKSEYEKACLALAFG